MMAVDHSMNRSCRSISRFKDTRRHQGPFRPGIKILYGYSDTELTLVPKSIVEDPSLGSEVDVSVRYKRGLMFKQIL